MRRASVLRLPRFVLGAVGAGVLLVALIASGAGAATSISQPRPSSSGKPFVVTLDEKGKPDQFTVVATGFAPGTLVYVEQCDPRVPSDPHWEPTRDCDIGSSPAAAIADAAGTARFPAGDVNHGFQTLTGLGPEGLFRCLPPSAPAAGDGLPEYRTCQLRVSSNNTQATTDQVFLPLAFGHAPAPSSGPPTTAIGAAASSSTGSSSTSGAMIAVVIVVAIAAIAAVVVVVRRRRPAPRSA